ncbi:MAG: hypothetical protein IPL53_21470 [Ignavibacteria bacterium]|nr:hypothetical protein [Ignavibacteria bacterium]
MNLRLNTYFYSWERADSTNPDFETSHLKGYQNLLIGVNDKSKKWSFNTSLLTQEDIVNKSGMDLIILFYNLYIKGTNLWNALDVQNRSTICLCGRKTDRLTG